VFPIIYVNNSTSKTRQIFTLFHELGHLLFGTSGIDTLDNRFVDGLPEQQREIEILCNRFAAEFLLPQKVFNEETAGRAPDEQTAELLAARFHVSREFIYRRFLDRGEISQTAYFQAAKKWAQQKKRSAPGGNPYWNKLAYLGRDYVAVAFSKYYQNRIHLWDVSRFTQTIAGLAATAAHHWEAAETHFQIALQQAESFPYRLEQAEIRRFHAMMLIDRAAPGDREKAQTLLREALESYTLIGMPRHSEVTEMLLARQ
jgi:Zn-dependent peptidase ImmA (M78 family)